MILALALSLLAGWQPAEVVVGDRLNDAVLAAGADGTLHLAGGQSLGPVEAPEFRYGVRTAPPGGAFGAERPLEAAGFEVVEVGVDAAGTATVLFERDGRLAVGIPPVALSTHRTGARTLAVAPGGAAIAAWVERAGGEWRVVAAIREGGERRVVAATRGGGERRVVAATRGGGERRVVAATRGGGERRVVAATRDGGAFGPPQVVSGAVPPETRVTVAIGSRGDAILVWTDASEYGKPGFAAIRRPGGPFGAPVQVARRTAELRPAVGEDGTVLLALSRLQQLDVRVFRNRLTGAQTLPCDDGLLAATVNATGRALVLCRRKRLETWEGRARLRRTARLRTGSISGAAAVDLAADGSALVTWPRDTPRFLAASRVVATLRRGDGAFSPPVAITEDFPAVEPVAARLLPGGGAMVVAETFGEAGRSMLALRHR